MNAELNTWTQTQELLVQLIKILHPLVVKQEEASFFSEKVFYPPSAHGEAFAHSVQVLPQLKRAQGELKELIAQMPDPPSAVRYEEKKRSEAPLPKIPPQEVSEETEEWREKAPPFLKKAFEERLRASPLNKPSSFEGQAKELLRQVRVTIQSLAVSANWVEPKYVVIRDAIKRLKPMVDSLIKAVAKTEAHTSLEQAPRRIAAPVAVREKSSPFKPIALPFKERETVPVAPSRSVEKKEEARKLPHPAPKIETPRPSPTSLIKELRAPFPARAPLPAQESALMPSPTPPVVHPTVPYIAEPPFSSHLKKKKKKKFFWEKEEKSEKDSD